MSARPSASPSAIPSAIPSASASSSASASASPLAGSLMALLAATLWGTTGTAQSLAPLDLSAYWVGALRLAVAAVFFLVVVLATLGPAALRAALARLSPGRVLLAAACIAAYNLAFFAGVRATGVAVGTAVAIGSGPIWAGLLETAVTRRPPAAAWWGGTLLAVAGGALLVIGGSGASAQPVSGVGLGLCLLAGLSYAAWALLNQQLLRQASPAVATFVVFGGAALLALPLAALLAGLPVLGGRGLPVLLYLGVVATGVSYLLFSSGQRHIAASTAVTLALGEPLTAFVLAIVVVGEQPPVAAYGGLALVLAGLVLVVRAELRAARPAAD